MWAKLIPFRDYLYAAIAVAAISWYNIHVHNLIVADEHKRDAAVAAESAKVQTDALAREAQDLADYTANLKKANDRYAQSIQVSDAAHAADLSRLQRIAAQGSGGASLPSSTSANAPPDSGRSSLVGLGYVSAELAGALRDARDDLVKCYAERDSLTGK